MGWSLKSEEEEYSSTLHFPSANFRSMFRRAFVLLVASKMPTYKNREKKINAEKVA
jgi:hypothetical protein